MPSSLVTAFLAALQASLSVLLTIFYGVLSAQFGLLTDKSAKNVSSLCVKLLLPALLLTNVGSQIDLESGKRYLPIIVWGLVYNIISIAFSLAMRRLFKLPNWVTPAITFNNTTALPLLLMQSLAATGVLDSLLWGGDDSSSNAVERAKSYFLVNSMISDSLTFGLGPKFLSMGGDEDGSEQGRAERESPFNAQTTGERDQSDLEVLGQSSDGEEEAIEANEESSLLPNKVVRAGTRASHRGRRVGMRYWRLLPRWVQVPLSAVATFINAPLVGAIIGVVIGIVPKLKTVFFNQPDDGGIFKAWLTVSVQNLGDLFPALQIVVVGVKLKQSMQAMKKGEDSGVVPWGSMLLVIIVRFLIWPAISIPLIWAVASRTNLLNGDPILWFSMMIMPAGPPALKLIALGDVTGADEASKMSMAKFLTISYAICPLMTFGVVGALKAANAAL